MPFTDIEKKREWQRNWMRQRREDWLKVNGPCAQCGSSEQLEIDHVDPTEKVSHRIFSWSKVRREAELAKCQVLCGECHKKKTAAQHLAKLKHGTVGMYENHGCRCEPCRARKSEENAKRRVMGWQ